MNTYIVLLRGINVGGRNSLPMKELVEILKALGCENVQTYIQSGNVVLRSGIHDTARLSSEIAQEIKRHRGFEPHILLLGVADFNQAIGNNPFPEAESVPKSLHLGFLDAVPKNPDLKALDELKVASERFQLKDRVFYLHAPDGIGRSKLAAKTERLLGVPMTSRNWRTVGKIMELSER